MAPDRSALERPIRTIFFGSGPFAVPILDAVVARRDLEIAAVVTPIDRPSGRYATPTPVPVAAVASTLGLPVLRLRRVREPEAVAAVDALRPTLGVLADFGQIIPPSILGVPALGILNVHPSILPRHRGASPIQATILAGDAVAGVSVMQMDAGMDTGPILGMRTWAIASDTDAPALEAEAAATGARLLMDVLDLVFAGAAVAVPQDASRATTTRPLRREDGRLDPALPAAVLERQVRAFRPWPGSYLELGSLRLTVHEAEVLPPAADDRSGPLVAEGDGIALTTSDGRLGLTVVQAAGGRPMSGAAYLRGHPGLIRSASEGGRR